MKSSSSNMPQLQLLETFQKYVVANQKHGLTNFSWQEDGIQKRKHCGNLVGTHDTLNIPVRQSSRKQDLASSKLL